MKKLLAIFTLGLAAMVFFPATASADHPRRADGRCHNCGGTVYSFRIQTGYDSYRRPLYSWVRKPHYNCSRSSSYRSPSYGYSRSPSYYRSRPDVGFSISIGKRYPSSYRYGNSCRSGSSFSIRIR